MKIYSTIIKKQFSFYSTLLLLALCFVSAFITKVNAQTALFWKGAGTWNTTNVNWGTVTGGPYTTATWTNGDIATFENTAGTVTIGSAVSAAGLNFTKTAYILNGAGVLTLSGTPTITIGTAATALTEDIDGPISVANQIQLVSTGTTGKQTLNFGPGGATVTSTNVLSNGMYIGNSFAVGSRMNGNMINAFGTSGNAGPIVVAAPSFIMTCANTVGTATYAVGTIPTNTVYNDIQLNPTPTAANFGIALGATKGASGGPNFIINYNGVISGNSDVYLGNAVAQGSGGAGGTMFSNSNNTYNGKTFLTASSKGFFQAGSNNCFPTTNQFVYGTLPTASDGYGIVDLNGYNVTLGSIESNILTPGGTGTVVANYGITNSSGTLSTLTINGGGTSNPTATFAATIGTNTNFNAIPGTNTGITGSNNIALTLGTGAGALTLSGINTFTGGLTVSGGTIQMGVANALSSSLPVTLDGGVFKSGSAVGYSQTVGTLNLTNSSALNLGTGSHTITFAASNGVSWTAGKTLTIIGWLGGYNGTSGTSGQIFFGSSNTGLTAAQLSQITFFDGTNNYNAILLGTGELVPIVCPKITSLVSNSPICTGSTLNLTVNATGTSLTYLWSGTGTFSSTGVSNPTVSGAATGTYTVIVTNSVGCSSAANQVVTVNALPIANISGTSAICIGNNTVLTASGGNSYAWTESGTANTLSGQTTATVVTVSPTTSTTYTVIVTNANGCSSATNQVVMVNVLPVGNISGTFTICNGNNTILTASGGTSYSWSESGIGNTLNGQATATVVTVSPTTTTTYTAIVTNANGCSSATNQIVMVNVLPIANISGTSTICNGNNTILTVSGGTSYSWSESGIGNTLSGQITATVVTVSPTTTTTYTVIVTNANGCTAATNQVVTVNPLAKANITPNGSTVFCTGGSVMLTASGGTTYVWSTGATSTAITVTTGGTYTVTVTNNCSSATTSQTVTITSSAVAQINASGSTTFCQGGNVTLTTSGGTAYTWSTGATSTTISPTNSGTYTVTVTSSCGTATASQSVVVNSLPVAQINASGTTTFCQGGSVTLTASGGTNYLWSDAETTVAITAGNNTTYTATVTNANGCTATANQLVTVNSLPTPTITPSGTTTFCNGSSVTFTASGGTGYIWSTAATTAGVTVSPTTTATYTVTVTNANGCTKNANQVLTVNPLPTASISANGTTNLCTGGSVMLTASGGTGYMWSTAATTAGVTVSPTTTTTYTLTVTNTNGCANTASQIITVNPLPTATITSGGNTTICSGSSVTLTASGGTSYTWSNGATTNTIMASATNTYIVTVTNGSGCMNTASQTVTVNPLPTATITPSGTTTICSGGSVTLTAGGGVAYLWSTGSTTTVITVNSGANYTVTVSNSNGCMNTTRIKITQATALSVTLKTNANGKVIAMVTGGTLPYSYNWSNNATTDSIMVTQSGTYTVTITDNLNCNTTANIVVNLTGISLITKDNLMDVKIFPNPSNDKFNINYNLSKNEEVELNLYNLIGERIIPSKHEAQNAGDHQLTIGNNLASGVYMLEIRIGENIRREKVVKQ